MHIYNESPHEECGVFGISLAERQPAAPLVYHGLYALQHRGQESCGIIVNHSGLFAAERIGFPLVLRPVFTLGGTGGGFAETSSEFPELLRNALAVFPVHEVLIEKSVRGYKEIEYEVMRDANDTAITVCNMENMDPVGIHTGDSIVVCPSQTLTNKEYHMLRDSALKLIRALKVEGGCNVQFALDPKSFQYYLIVVNPRVSRSSRTTGTKRRSSRWYSASTAWASASRQPPARRIF